VGGVGTPSKSRMGAVGLSTGHSVDPQLSTRRWVWRVTFGFGYGMVGMASRNDQPDGIYTFSATFCFRSHWIRGHQLAVCSGIYRGPILGDCVGWWVLDPRVISSVA
jgi:hypothetical protein